MSVTPVMRGSGFRTLVLRRIVGTWPGRVSNSIPVIVCFSLVRFQAPQIPPFHTLVFRVDNVQSGSRPPIAIVGLTWRDPRSIPLRDIFTGAPP